MILASMTGFARAAASIPQGNLAWEIKTVNARGLDLRLRLPGGFDAYEADYRGRIAAVLGRGTCQAGLSVQRPPQPPEIRIDPAVLQTLIKAIGAAASPESTIGPVTMDGLLAIRGVVEVSEPTDDPAAYRAIGEAGAALLDEALARLDKARRGEGEALGKLLLGRLDQIAALTRAAEQTPGRSVAAVRERLVRSVAALLDSVPALDPNRLHQEAIMLAARSDIREELDRLAIHRQSAAELIAGGGVVGRRLDFLAQELAREANTLCAKSNDAALTAIGLDLRHQIEQFREQVQNLE
jgi:uncharacterized protein (TIGR00255 family)